MLFVRKDKLKLKIGDVLFLDMFKQMQGIPWFLGMIGESNGDNIAAQKMTERFYENGQYPFVPIKNVAYKNGKFTNMNVWLNKKSIVKDLEAKSREFVSKL